jgi:hypothetical protein
MFKKVIGIIVGVCLCLAQAFAETQVEEAVRLSKLTISAIECSVLASDGNEAQRLGEIGFAAGKKFLDVIARLSTEEQKSANQNIALLWHGVPGPNSDFVLGRVWQEVEHNVYRLLGDDTEAWKNKKERMYSE